MQTRTFPSCRHTCQSRSQRAASRLGTACTSGLGQSCTRRPPPHRLLFAHIQPCISVHMYRALVCARVCAHVHPRPRVCLLHHSLNSGRLAPALYLSLISTLSGFWPRLFVPGRQLCIPVPCENSMNTRALLTFHTSYWQERLQIDVELVGVI